MPKNQRNSKFRKEIFFYLSWRLLKNENMTLMLYLYYLIYSVFDNNKRKLVKKYSLPKSYHHNQMFPTCGSSRFKVSFTSYHFTILPFNISFQSIPFPLFATTIILFFCIVRGQLNGCCSIHF